MSYLISGLSPSQFAPLFDLDDAALSARGIDRFTVDAQPGFPCRTSLEDAPIGNRVLLLHHCHLPDASPYQAAGPIFVARHDGPVAEFHNELPPMLTTRLLSLRAYDARHRMIEAEVVPGQDLEDMIERFFGNESVRYMHVHFARRGCYAARIDRNPRCKS